MTARYPTYPINPIILNRGSSRSMSGESLSDKELMPLFEAARWAPSSYNNQPWRFIYAKRDSTEWNLFLSLLTPANLEWCLYAGVLIVMISRKFFEFNQKPSITHSFDAGAAWENLALEGTSRGYVIHAMQGFDYVKAQKELKIPDEYKVEAMIAIGKKGAKESLSADLQKLESPTNRRPLKELCSKGIFSFQ